MSIHDRRPRALVETGPSAWRGSNRLTKRRANAEQVQQKPYIASVEGSKKVKQCWGRFAVWPAWPLCTITRNQQGVYQNQAIRTFNREHDMLRHTRIRSFHLCTAKRCAQSGTYIFQGLKERRERRSAHDSQRRRIHRWKRVEHRGRCKARRSQQRNWDSRMSIFGRLWRRSGFSWRVVAHARLTLESYQFVDEGAWLG